MFQAGHRLAVGYRIQKGNPQEGLEAVLSQWEALDCFVYAYAAAVLKGLSRMTDEGWDQLEGMIINSNDEGETVSQNLACRFWAMARAWWRQVSALDTSGMLCRNNRYAHILAY